MAEERAVPPYDIAPGEFFELWVPQRVANDAQRRAGLGDTRAVLEFRLEGDGGGHFTVQIAAGVVVGRRGAAGSADLRVMLDVETWRALNRGELSAPEAFLRRRVRLEGNHALAVKLHLILG
jgi:putative sterol carrier protein